MASNVVIIGLGYVGLPLAQAALSAGHSVTGLDTDMRKIQMISDSESYVDDIADSDIKNMLALGFKATNDAQVIRDADIVVITVPTPLSAEGGPDLTAVESATSSIREHMKDGALVILESTTYPGTTDTVVKEILESSGKKLGQSFDLAFSPERVDPGNPIYGIQNTPKVVGGVNAEGALRAHAFYSSFISQVIMAKSAREAEMAKLIENTYRHVNIALMNELVQYASALDTDLFNAIECAATKPYGFQAFYPGPGVGGHCIPIDPRYLSHEIKRKLGRPFRIVELAEEINSGMPRYVVQRCAEILNESKLSLNGSRVLLLGVTYKANIADTRESPATEIAKLLIEAGVELSYHDPHVDQWNVQGHDSSEVNYSLSCVSELGGEMQKVDLVVLLQVHSSYDLQALSDSETLVLDTRGKIVGKRVFRL